MVRSQILSAFTIHVKHFSSVYSDRPQNRKMFSLTQREFERRLNLVSIGSFRPLVKTFLRRLQNLQYCGLTEPSRAETCGGATLTSSDHEVVCSDPGVVLFAIQPRAPPIHTCNKVVDNPYLTADRVS